LGSGVLGSELNKLSTPKFAVQVRCIGCSTRPYEEKKKEDEKKKKGKNKKKKKGETKEGK